jgi:2-methylisocitrate lyase-like PEP mutase family enzyme
VSAAALRALHVPGDPLVLPNAWDAGSARLVERAGFPAVATTSSGVADGLGYADGEQAPATEMLAAVERIARAVSVPVTADAEAGYGLPGEELTARVLAAGAVGLNLEDTDHPRKPALVDSAAHVERIAAVKRGGDVVLNCRVDVQLRGGSPAEGLERARRYAEAGADCVYPIGVTDEREIAAYVALGVPVNILALPDAPAPERLAALGVARISYGELIHAGLMRALAEHLRAIPLRPRVSGP